MTIEVALLILVFISLLLLSVPIAICIGLATAITIAYVADLPSAYIVAQRLSNGVGSFPLLAIPFFVLSGFLMGESGMARRLMDFAFALMGRFRGGLAYVNTLTCMLFGALSGSATAAVSSIGGFMIPQMRERGYSKPFAVALTSTSATTGLLIPPSNIMIVYAVVAGEVSVAALFLAGIIPGILVGLLLMVVCFFANIRTTVPPGAAASFKEVLQSGFNAVPSLFLIFIVLGGILGGVFSATEASAIAAAYSLLLGTLIYKSIPVQKLPQILLSSAKTTSVVMFLVGTSQAMSWILAYENVPLNLSNALLELSDNPLVILLLINLLLLMVGAFMDMTPAVLIFTPIFLPVVLGLGFDPVHFGILLIANLSIGLCTPPVGTCLFVGCSVGKIPISTVIKPMIPFFVAMFVALMLISYIPQLSLWLPRLFGL